ncbi:MAG: carboxypeptidase-like regulatory domain-containing protein, partial [Candidatus Margulisbacteria bacterium]|nr:carboxypeptidase-like regulatory domain-containing protein [Candidatus Margulisiibacteriota bacterium]
NQNIENALVQAYFVTEPNTWFWIASANTDSSGEYTLRGGYSNKQNSQTQIFLQISAAGYTETTTNPIIVEVSKNYTGQNYKLEGAAYVKGTVVNVSANKTVTINAFEKGSNFVFAGEVTVNGNDATAVDYVLPIKANKNLVVRAAVSGYEDLWYDQKISSADATTVNQAVGTTKDVVDFDFAGHKQWLIAGVVTDTDDIPLGGLTVNVFVKNSDYAGPDGGSVRTGGDGKFSLQLAPTGDLVLQVVTANQYIGYPTGTYYKKNMSGVISSADATLLAYSAGDQDINFKVDRFWLVCGAVTPVNIEAVIDLYEYDGANIDWSKNKGWVTADASGQYEIRGTGNVTVNIRAATGNYIAKEISQAALRSENTYTYNFNLTLGASISGWVTANGSGTVTISAQDIDGRWETFVTRDGAGIYTIPRVPAGAWLVYAQQDNCVAEYYGETTSTKNAVRVNLAAGQTTDNINIEIDREWTIEGYVKKSDSSPIQDAEVDVWRSLDPTWDFIGRAKTDASGCYIVTGGYNNVDVYIRVSADGYETKYYADKYIMTEANTINMAPGNQKTGVDFILQQVWKVAGNVKDAQDNPLSGARVSLIDYANTQNILGVYTTDASGEYQFVSVDAVVSQLFLLVEKDAYVPSSSATFNVSLGNSVNIYFVLQLSAAPVHPLPAGQSVLDTVRSGPNPADPEKGPIHIGFILDGAARVRVKVYTLGGEIVFQDDQHFPVGYGEFVWSGTNLYDRRLPNGVYLAYVEIDTGREKLRKVLKIAILR